MAVPLIRRPENIIHKMIIYKIKCPSCAQQADSLMKAEGLKGTYRELYANYIPYKVVCAKCGLIKEIEDGLNYRYELWFKTSFKGNSLWAYNIKHINEMITWLEKGKRTPGDYYESLPNWMVTNRQAVIKKLEQLRENG